MRSAATASPEAAWSCPSPIGLPEEFGITGHTFSDFGTLGDIDSVPANLVSQTNVKDEDALRLSIGAGLSWRSPLGPIRIDLAFPIIKEDYDKPEEFRFSFGTRF